MGRVANKVALVSGAASGLGDSIARMLAREGASVVLADVNDLPAHMCAGRSKPGEGLLHSCTWTCRTKTSGSA